MGLTGNPRVPRVARGFGIRSTGNPRLRNPAQEVTDILQFWNGKTTTWHDLSQVARGLLAVPATSTSSERSFSLAERTLEERRTQLAGDNIDALLVLHGLE